MSRERVVDPHGRVTIDEYLAWWDAAIRVSGDPALGLRVGATMRPGALGGFDYLLRNIGTLEEILGRANEFLRLIDEASVVELVRAGGKAMIRVHRRGGYPIADAEMHAFFSACLTILRVEWPQGRMDAVRFAHPAPDDPQVFVRHFGCPVRFGAEHHEIEFDAALLSVLPANSDRNLGRVLEDHARHLLEALPSEDPFLVSVRGELRKLIDRGEPSLQALAKALHTSERTLRRRLEDEGTSYQSLLDGMRADLARAWVASTRDGFEAIAERLAFADASTFFRAFKRWTGVTPAQYRQREKERGA
jgi:AraC-like DNA-binding protein